MGRGALIVRPITMPDEASRACARLIGLLPDWFGQPDANRAYVAGVADCLCHGAFDDDGRCLGLIALRPHFGTTLEVWWMAVEPGRHRQGIGTRLMAAALHEATRAGCHEMVLMTLGEDSDDPGYAATRRIYMAQGFRPLVHDHMCDPETPLIWMIRPIGGTIAPAAPRGRKTAQ
jgi:GNAT superfamily N-acetyltransferase